MLRATWLSAQNEVRLLAKDPVVLLMLLLAPVVIITVAGYSLGAIYGGAPHSRVLPVVDHDGGEVAVRLVAALREEPSVRVEVLPDVGAARRLVGRTDGPPLAIEIPAGTTAAIRRGGSPRLVLYVDPTKRIETNALEVRLAELCRRALEDAQASAQVRLDQAEADLRREIAEVVRALRDGRERVRTEVAAARAAADETLRAQFASAAAAAGRRIEAEIQAREQRAWSALESQLSERGALLDDLRARLRDLQASEAEFGEWLAHVRAMAGSHAADLPQPPAFPALPSDAELVALARPIVRPAVERGMPMPAAPVPAIAMPPIDPPADPLALGRLDDLRFERLPGVLGLTEMPATPGADVTVNAFDQYVPGFGVTFLLIGMMLGIALTLFDERDWGTLQRLGASGVPVPALLLGKLLTRFTVGVGQMAVLFAVGRALFGISLGRTPLALLLPTAGISFAAAALGLVVSALAQSHDGVMPLGTMLSMAMSAIGGCWWPIGFEPPWMRQIALALPTTWAMQAYNDLMIRRAPWESALWPLTVMAGLGCLYLVAGITGNIRRGRD